MPGIYQGTTRCRATTLPGRIGENGHIAFNEPAEADFDDPLEMKIVTL